MNQDISINYFTPINRVNSMDKSYFGKSQKSTADKFYDLQQSYKHYQKLLQQNLYLKNLMVQQQSQHNSISPHKSGRKYENSQLCISQKHGRNLNRTNSSCKLHNCSLPLQFGSDSQYKQDYQHYNDISLWAIKQRNKFLEEKVDNLKEQYIRQTTGIKKVKTSQKWKNRFDCTKISCYEKKYIQLLRVRSPVLLQ